MTISEGDGVATLRDRLTTRAQGRIASVTDELIPRNDYAALERCTYFNQAALGLIPRSTVAVMREFMERTAQFGNLHLSDEQEAAILDDVRSSGADMLGAPVDAVAVVGGASEGLGQVASILEPEARTVVLVGSDFPSVTYPWLAAARRRDVTLRFVEDRPDTDLTDGLIDAIDATTSVVAFGAVQYGTGSRVGIQRVTAAAHEVGARVVVDATQLAGAEPVRMSEWRADAVVTSGYKWLSTHGGVALIAVASELRDRLPALVGWKGTTDPFDFDAGTLHLADDARRFELSTMSYASAIGLDASVRMLSSVGFDMIEEHADHLAAELTSHVEPLGWHPFRPPSVAGASSHILSLRHPDHDAAAVAARLAERGIICGTRAGGIRISLHAYNNSGDTARLVAALAEL